jgi:adenine-specific DNA methylase
MYETNHIPKGGGKAKKGKINYTVWSDVFICLECAEEIVFWEAAVDHEAGKVRKIFQCPHCNASLTKRKIDRATETVFDDALNTTITRAKQVPVLINYSVEEGGKKKRYNKKPDADDFALIENIESTPIPYWFPTDEMPDGYNTRQPRISHGITHVHHFYTKRNLFVLAALTNFIRTIDNSRMGKCLRFLISSYDFTHSTKMTRMIFKSGYSKPVLTSGQSGTLYVSSLPVEKNIFEGLERQKLPIILKSLREIRRANLIETTDGANVSLPCDSIDYIFTDPPYSGNLMYSELNFLWESWLRVKTNNKPEAIENKTQGKSLLDYQHLMEDCFRENYRILKPGRWMTVEFHNSKNSVWSAIQEAIFRAGFVVADARTLDKKQGTFKQVTTTSAVKQDLIISAYKPRADFEQQFELEAGTEEGVWSFVRQHLEKLPVVVHEKGVIQVIAERQAFLLYSRMIAFHIQRGAKVPMSAPEFYRGLDEKFIERDGMYFLPTQVAEYDKVRTKTSNVQQLELFVTDEQSAVQWLRRDL